ncbi:hypothetical protein [Microbulbifer rhizosphaerae]|uniref:Uncharacterized protein n=1 Tax=Microbulbifer rhizosphaerae TaxID=1562603 RepID=A0A7W4ZBW2_9GAMM|nr:hypothetical protein [Microbulbifer rhizosphaerae]MBB3062834.1 hypothetical protein [Microbulbifer rhizosphaerae]
MKDRFPGSPGEHQRKELIEVAHSPEILTLSKKNLSFILKLLKNNYPHDTKAGDHNLLTWKEAFLRVKSALDEKRKKNHVRISNAIQALILIVLLLTLGHQIYKDSKPAPEPAVDKGSESNETQNADVSKSTKGD